MIGYCSFPDSSCSSGRRFGEQSGAHANQCVDTDQTTDDAGVDAPLVDTSPGSCPAGFATLPAVATHMYKTIATGDWPSQKAACEALGTGVYLAVPDDMTELQALVSAAAASPVWVGIDDSQEGVYKTVRGQTFSDTSPLWDNNEPNNQPISGGGQADCVAAVESSKRLVDDDCDQTWVAVCECE
jgi:hypothetical protein